MFIKSTPIIVLLLAFFSQVQSQSNLWDEIPADSELVIDSLEVVLPQTNDESKVLLLNKLAELYWLVDPDYTIKYASEALQLSKNYENQAQEGLALINLCQGYLFNDLYDKALEYGLRSLEIREELGDPYDIAFSLRTLGWLYYDIQHYDKALEYHRKVLALHQELKDPEREAYSYNSIGLIQSQKGAYNLALSLFKKSLHLKKPFGNQYRISETLKNMGICYAALQSYDSAVEVFNRSLAISNQIKDDYNKAEILNQLAGIYLHQGEYQVSLNSFEQARQILVSLKDNKELTAANNEIASDYYQKLGDFEKSLFYHQQYDKVSQEIISGDESQKLTEMQILYEAERRENEIKLLEQQRLLAQQRNQGLIIVMILLIIIGALIVGRLRSSIRKRKIIYEQNQQLANERLKNEELHSSKLEDKLEFRRKELTNLALLITQRNEIYENLSKSMKNLDFIDREDANNKINGFLKDYASKLNANGDLQKFHTNIDHINDEFFYRLRTKYPHLTDNDLKMSGQLRLSLSSKEIASINNISVKSVEISRYRLRKKLHLDKKEVLTDFLKEF